MPRQGASWRSAAAAAVAAASTAIRCDWVRLRAAHRCDKGSNSLWRAGVDKEGTGGGPQTHTATKQTHGCVCGTSHNNPPKKTPPPAPQQHTKPQQHGNVHHQTCQKTTPQNNKGIPIRRVTTPHHHHQQQHQTQAQKNPEMTIAQVGPQIVQSRVKKKRGDTKTALCCGSKAPVVHQADTCTNTVGVHEYILMTMPAPQTESENFKRSLLLQKRISAWL